jgi:hypothetical protein
MTETETAVNVQVHADLVECRKRVAALQADAGSTDLERRVSARNALPQEERRLDDLTLAALRADRAADEAREKPLADELAAANDALAVVAGEHAVDRSLTWPRLESAKTGQRELVVEDCPTCHGTTKIRVDKEDVACADCHGTGHQPAPWNLAGGRECGWHDFLLSAAAAGLLDE